MNPSTIIAFFVFLQDVVSFENLLFFREFHYSIHLPLPCETANFSLKYLNNLLSKLCRTEPPQNHTLLSIPCLWSYGQEFLLCWICDIIDVTTDYLLALFKSVLLALIYTHNKLWAGERNTMISVYNYYVSHSEIVYVYIWF